MAEPYHSCKSRSPGDCRIRRLPEADNYIIPASANGSAHQAPREFKKAVVVPEEKNMKIAFIGAGVMGEAIISAIISKKIASPDSIWACDIDKARLDLLDRKYSINCTADIQSAIHDCEIIVLSIKPQTLSDVTGQLKGKLKNEQLVLSIIAGTRIGTITSTMGHNSVVRVMPNTPAQIGEGMSVWTATDGVNQEQRNMAQTILQAMGKEIYLSDEKYIDMATAISGSGPAYIFLVIEAFIDAAVHIGLPRDLAGELALQTMLGSARMVLETGKHPAELRNSVTSPGGTTAEGLLYLEDGGLRAIITQAVIATYNKAQLLGSENNR